MARPLIALAALASLTLAGCQGGSAESLIPSVGAEVVLRDVTIKIDEAQVRLLLTPAELKSLAESVDPGGSGGGGGGGGGQ